MASTCSVVSSFPLSAGAEELTHPIIVQRQTECPPVHGDSIGGVPMHPLHRLLTRTIICGRLQQHGLQNSLECLASIAVFAQFSNSLRYREVCSSVGFRRSTSENCFATAATTSSEIVTRIHQCRTNSRCDPDRCHLP